MSATKDGDQRVKVIEDSIRTIPNWPIPGELRTSHYSLDCISLFQLHETESFSFRLAIALRLCNEAYILSTMLLQQIRQVKLAQLINSD